MSFWKLFAFNLFLASVLFFLADPFRLTNKNYEDAPPLLSPKKIESVRIQKLDSHPYEIEISSFSSDKPQGLLKSAYPFPVDPVKKKNLETSLFQLRRHNFVGTWEDLQSELGSAEYKIHCQFEDSTESSLVVFQAIARGGRSYVQKEGEPEVWIVPENLRLVLGRGYSEHFVQTRITPLGLSPVDVVKIELIGKNGYSIQQNELGWVMSKPKQGRVSSEEIGRLLERIVKLDATQLVLDGILPKLSLSHPHTLRYFWKTSQVNEPIASIELEYLGKSNDKGHYYRNLNQNTTFRLEEYQIQAFWIPNPETLVGGN